MKKQLFPSLLEGPIALPRSKSHAIRGLILAALADTPSTIEHLPSSSDVLSCISCLRNLGVSIDTNGTTTNISGGLLKTIDSKRKSPVPLLLDCGNSGTTLFILTATIALASQNISLDGDSSLRLRSAKELLNALTMLGVLVESGPTPPYRITGPITNSTCSISCPTSQFLTALLITLPFAPVDTTIEVTSLTEIPYVHMTLSWLDRCGIQYSRTNLEQFSIQGQQSINAFKATIGRDASAASFFACAAILQKSELTLLDLDLDDNQGDFALFDLLEEQGCTITKQKNASGTTDLTIDGSGFIGSSQVNLEHMPDAVPAYAVLATKAEKPTTITNIAHVRRKECDRIHAIETELTKMGIETKSTPDSLTIIPGPLKGASLDGHSDHRILMACTIAALAADRPSTIGNAQDAAITYPSFYEDLEALGARIETSRE